MAPHELGIACDAASVGALVASLEQAGALAVSLSDAADAPLFEPAPGEHPMWGECRVVGLFVDADAARSARAALLAAGTAGPIEVVEVVERDWVLESQTPAAPVRHGRRLWAAPPGEAVPDPDAVVVRMVPGLAFGSGSHETTALCLEWLDACAVDGHIAGAEVVDYGCGSGILAIAAAKLGAGRVFAVDHDTQALAATRDNACANGVGERVIALPDRLLPRGIAADLVVANILAGALQDLAPRLLGLLRNGGALALSGVLAEQAGQVEQAYRALGCSAFSCRARGDWIRIDTERAARDID